MMRISCLLLLLLLVTGCSGTKNKIVPVEGKIAFMDGRKLPAGTKLQFSPFEGDVKSSTATVSADGSFSAVHQNGRRGAETGKYIVRLRAPDNDENFYKTVPSVYYNEGIPVEVAEGMASLDLKVNSRK